MRRGLAVVADLLSGVALALIAFVAVRVLLQSARLVYLFFPLLCTAAFAVGWWRGGKGTAALAATAILTTAPLFALAAAFFSGRNKPVIVLPLVALVLVLAGAVCAQLRAKAPAVAAALVAANIVAAFAGPPYVRLIAGTRHTNERAIPFVLHLVDGRTISSTELRGRVVILDFWATWCVPCRSELPVIQHVYDRVKNRRDVALFAIDGVLTDTPGDVGDTAARASEYFRRGGFTIPLVYDSGGVLEKDFSLNGFPSLLLLDADGGIRMRHLGFIGSEGLEANLLREIDTLASPERSGQSQRPTQVAPARTGL